MTSTGLNVIPRTCHQWNETNVPPTQEISAPAWFYWLHYRDIRPRLDTKEVEAMLKGDCSGTEWLSQLSYGHFCGHSKPILDLMKLPKLNMPHLPDVSGWAANQWQMLAFKAWPQRDSASHHITINAMGPQNFPTQQNNGSDRKGLDKPQ